MIGKKRIIIPGAFVSPKEENELEKLQKRKTILMLLSTLFFATAILMPADITALSTYTMSLAVMVYIIAIIVTVIVALLGKKRQKIQKAVPSRFAPAKGYNRFTYTSYEFFVFVHVLLVAVQIYLVVLSVSVFMILSCVSMGVSLAFAIISRQVFFLANKDMEFVPLNQNVSVAEEDEFYRVDNDKNQSYKEENQEQSDTSDESEQDEALSSSTSKQVRKVTRK